MFQISYLDLWRYVIKIFNLMSLSDTLWLAYIVEIQTSTNHSILKLVQSRMWILLGQYILREGHEWAPIWPRRLSWRPYFYFSHIWISHKKKSCMLLIYHDNFDNYWNVHQENNIPAKKEAWKSFTIFTHSNCCTQISN